MKKKKAITTTKKPKPKQGLFQEVKNNDKVGGPYKALSPGLPFPE